MSTKKVSENGDKGIGRVGLDSYGGGVLDLTDPTKNVRELFLAESDKRDDLRDADKATLDLHISYLEKLAAAESRRIDGLAAQGQRYEERIAEDLKVGVKTTSDQLAGQLIKETGSLSNQISTMNLQFTNQITTLTTSTTNQIAALTASITPRLADLERFRWEVGGKTSVQDPQTASEIITIKAMLKTLADTQNVGTGVKKGNDATIAWVVTAVTGFFMFVSLIIAGATLFLKH